MAVWEIKTTAVLVYEEGDTGETLLVRGRSILGWRAGSSDIQDTLIQKTCVLACACMYTVNLCMRCLVDAPTYSSVAIYADLNGQIDKELYTFSC